MKCMQNKLNATMGADCVLTQAKANAQDKQDMSLQPATLQNLNIAGIAHGCCGEN